MTEGLNLECTVHFHRAGPGHPKQLTEGEAPAPPEPPPERLLRVTRLLALAHHFEHLLRVGMVADYAELARLGQVSRARISQIMNLLLLAPSIQEEILFLPPVYWGRDPILMWQVLSVAAAPDWRTQRSRWQRVRMQGQRGR